MSTSFSAGGASMAAALRLLVSTLRPELARGRLVKVAALMLTLATVGVARVNAQEVVEYYGTDALGSLRVVFAPDGTVKSRSDYLPFGEEWQPATPGGPLPTQRFTGQQRDIEEGHDNFVSRTYLTRTGRMNSVDSVFSGLLEPQRWNRYVYAVNNPLLFVDPDGRDPIVPNFTTGVTVTDPYSTYMNVSWAWGMTGGNYTVDGVQAISFNLFEDYARSLPNGSYGGEIFYQWGATDRSGDSADDQAAAPSADPPTSQPTPPACSLPCTPPPPPTDGPTLTTPGVVGWKTGQYELVFNRKGHNIASVGVGAAAVVGGAVMGGAAWTAPLRYDLVRFGVSKVPNQLVYGPGVWGTSWIASIKGGGADLPFHYHIHLYNWTQPWLWFQKTPVMKTPLNR